MKVWVVNDCLIYVSVQMPNCLLHSHKHSKALNDALQLMQVVDDLQIAGADAAPSLLPALKRRNSGKRNLHRPWTAVEEDELVRLVEQAEHRKQVTCSLQFFFTPFSSSGLPLQQAPIINHPTA